MNHRTIVQNFAERRMNKKTNDVTWRGGKVSCSGRALHSYHWWPLAYYLEDGLFLKQGDAYSVSTSAHQSLVQSYCDGPTVSFSALEAASISPSEISVDGLVDWNPDTTIQLKRESTTEPWIQMDTEEEFSPPQQGMLVHIGHSDTQAYWHLLGASLVEASEGQYLCSMDERAYFVAQLSMRVPSVEAAFASLKPLPVQEAESLGKTVVRQGEWFFVDTEMTDRQVAHENGWTIKRLRDIESAVRPLPKRDVTSNSHECRYLTLHSGDILATGSVRHPDHSTLRLGKTWWRVHRNTEIRSWSQGGQFD